jgi:hypothetical protein
LPSSNRYAELYTICYPRPGMGCTLCRGWFSHGTYSSQSLTNVPPSYYNTLSNLWGFIFYLTALEWSLHSHRLWNARSIQRVDGRLGSRFTVGYNGKEASIIVIIQRTKAEKGRSAWSRLLAATTILGQCHFERCPERSSKKNTKIASYATIFANSLP